MRTALIELTDAQIIRIASVLDMARDRGLLMKLDEAQRRLRKTPRPKFRKINKSA